MPAEAVPRVALHQSVFTRLMVIMLALAVSLLLIVSLFFVRIFGPRFGITVHRLVTDYGRFVAAASPDREEARRIAERFDVQIRYEGPGGGWATDETLPAIARVVSGTKTPGRETAVYDAPGGGRYLFAWGHLHRMQSAHDDLLLMTLGLVLLVVVLAHLVIRRALRPLRTLHGGVAALGEGQLDVTLPRTSRDEFGALTEAFNQMVRRVAEMVRARDQLLLDVSHELRSPLTRMKVALELLPDGDKKARMNADVAEMEAMLAELLELERLRDGRAIRPERADLAVLVRQAAARFEGRRPGVEVLDAPPLEVEVDPVRVASVLDNLLENALKYSLPDSRTVEVKAAREGDRVVVRVSDDGPGIPESDLAGIFEPFYRVDRSRSRKTGGYGLGLSICKRIMLAHGGDVSAERNRGRGATFVLTFPAAR